MANEDKSNDLPKEIDEKYIKDLELHHDRCKEASDYAVSRFDILIISLSSGALAFSAGFIKDIMEASNKGNFILIKIAWILFGGAIIFNLLSQVTSYYANRIEMRIIKSIIKKEKGKKPLPDEAELEGKKTNLNTYTIRLNSISFFSFIIGTIFLIAFMFTHF